MSYSSYKIGKNTVRCKDTQTGISYTVDFNRPVKTYFISGDNLTGTIVTGEDSPIINFREVTYDIKTGRTIDSNCWTEQNYDFERLQSLKGSNHKNYDRDEIEHSRSYQSSNMSNIKDLAILLFLIYVAIEVFKRI